MSDEFNFDSLVPITIPVTYGGKTYTLCEANAEAAVQYRNAKAATLVWNDKGEGLSIRNPGGIEPLLVSLCLRDDKGQLVSQHIIRSWPEKVVKPLFDKAMEISNLSEPAPERGLLEQALAIPNAPCTLAVLRGFVSSLPTEQFSRLQSWLKPTPEETSKNSQPGTPATSA